MLDAVTGRREAERPWWFHALRGFAVTACIYGPFLESGKAVFGGRPFDWSDALLRSLGFGLLFGLFTIVVERSAGLKARRRAQRVLSSGQLPPDATAAEWRPFIEDQRRALRFGRVYFLLLTLLIAGLAAAATRHAGNGAWALWLYAGAMVGATVWVVVKAGRRLAVADRLLAELPPSD